MTDDDDRGGWGLSYDDDSVEVTGGRGVRVEQNIIQSSFLESPLLFVGLLGH